VLMRVPLQCAIFCLSVNSSSALLLSSSQQYKYNIRIYIITYKLHVNHEQ
jgi:hypothetical protein